MRSALCGRCNPNCQREKHRESPLFTKNSVAVFVIATLCAISGPAQVANAAYLEGVMSGLIETIDPDLETTAQVGDRVTMTYLVDMNTPDLMPGSFDGTFHVESVTIEVDDESVSVSGPDIYSAVLIRVYPQIYNQFAVRAWLDIPLAGISSPDVWMVLATWQIDPPPLLSDSLPTDLDLADFESRWFSLITADSRADGTIDFVSVRVVPEPGTLLQLVAAMVFSLRRPTAHR